MRALSPLTTSDRRGGRPECGREGVRDGSVVATRCRRHFDAAADRDGRDLDDALRHEHVGHAAAATPTDIGALARHRAGGRSGVGGRRFARADHACAVRDGAQRVGQIEGRARARSRGRRDHACDPDPDQRRKRAAPPVASHADEGYASSANAPARRCRSLDSLRSLGMTEPAAPQPRSAQPRTARYRLCLYIRSMISSYIGSASSGPDRIAADAQWRRWFRINSRPTDRSASCTEEIWVRISAQ